MRGSFRCLPASFLSNDRRQIDRLNAPSSPSPFTSLHPHPSSRPSSSSFLPCFSSPAAPIYLSVSHPFPSATTKTRRPNSTKVTPNLSSHNQFPPLPQTFVYAVPAHDLRLTHSRVSHRARAAQALKSRITYMRRLLERIQRKRGSWKEDRQKLGRRECSERV